jgi:NAD(P)-dependent dehydrogenase (short-subunit alcohol dehydrogenase family)
VENYDPRWDRVMQVNLGATFNVTRPAIPHPEISRGCIINMSSAALRLSTTAQRHAASAGA